MRRLLCRGPGGSPLVVCYSVCGLSPSGRCAWRRADQLRVPTLATRRADGRGVGSVNEFGALVMFVFFGATVTAVGSWLLHALARLQGRREGW